MKNVILKEVFLLFTVVFCLCCAQFVSAQQTKRGAEVVSLPDIVTGETYAIIIGISSYKNVTPLQYAHIDAMQFQAFLQSEAGGMVPKSNIEIFINEQAVHANVSDAISIVIRKAKAGDRVYFFFAGHGDMEDLTQIENGLLLLYGSPDGNYFGMKDDVLEIIDLKRYLAPLAQKGIEMIFVIDACRSGNLHGGIQGMGQTASALSSSWGREYKLLSCQPNQLSIESKAYGGGRGLFSLHMEEGLKGLADINNDSIVTFLELQIYLNNIVPKYSEYTQIPMISGDLSKKFVRVDPQLRDELIKQKAISQPQMAVVNTKGALNSLIDSLPPDAKAAYLSFAENLKDTNLIWPQTSNALADFKAFKQLQPGHALVLEMRRNLSAALNFRFNKIVEPLLKGEKSYSNTDECYYAAAELDSCMLLIGKDHYMYDYIHARKLYMDAMSLTWALSERDYNRSWKPYVERSIAYLEQSVKLEPNAAYTLAALGICYNFVQEFDKSGQVFQKYVDLRPNDIYAQYSLGLIFIKLKRFGEAEKIYQKLVYDHPEDLYFKAQLIYVFRENGKIDESLDLIHQLIKKPETESVGNLLMGIHYSKMNDYKSAIKYYKQAIKIDKTYASNCNNNIGVAFFIGGQNDSATFYFNQSIQVEPNAHAYFNLGVIEEIEKRPLEAVKHFRLSVDKAEGGTEAFLSSYHLYFGKSYGNTSSKEFTHF